jgi:hypothetical protein
MRRKRISTALFVILIVAVSLYFLGRKIWVPVSHRIVGPRTVAEVIADINHRRRSDIENRFVAKGVNYPPKNVVLLGIKDRATLEMWVEGRLIREYKFTAQSGGIGPKLKQGDRQIPEGIYHITGLNPNSSYYLSLRVDYPNRFDREQALIDGRTNLGGDIYIHGNSVSIGCIAIGDECIEEVFKVAHDTGLKNLKLIISPVDFREKRHFKGDGLPMWVAGLYGQIRLEMKDFEKSQAPPTR